MDQNPKPDPLEHSTFIYRRDRDMIQLQVGGLSLSELAQVATGLMLALPTEVRALAMLDLVNRMDDPAPSGGDIAAEIARSIGGGIKDGSAVHRVDDDGNLRPVNDEVQC